MSIAGPRRRLLFALATSEHFERAYRTVAGGHARRAAARYVAGETFAEAQASAGELHAGGLAVSLDLFGEREHDPARIAEIVDAYLALAPTARADTWLSVDPSHIGLELGPGRVATALRAIGERLAPGARLQVGAEECSRGEAILDEVLGAAAAGAPLTATLQANLRSSPDVGARLADAGVPIRLVKGAYVESAALAHAYGPPTDAAFLELARTLSAGGGVVIAATHDPALHAALPGDTPLEMLLGVRSEEARALAAAGRDLRIYAPYGDAWFRYWRRRLAEAAGAT